MKGLVGSVLVLSVLLNIFYLSQDNSVKLSFINPSNPELDFPIEQFNQETAQITEKESQELEKQFQASNKSKFIASNNKKENKKLIENEESFDFSGAETRKLAMEPVESENLNDLGSDGEIKDLRFDLKDALMKDGSFSEEDYAFYQELDRQRSLEISDYISQISNNAASFSLDSAENDEVLAINQKYKDILFERVGEENFMKYQNLVDQLNEQSVIDSEAGEEFYLLDF